MANFSWSRISTFNTCARKYDLRYVAGYEKKPSVENEGRMFGTAIHAGFAAYITALFHKTPAKLALDVAVAASRASIEEDTVKNKTYFDWNDSTEKPDLDYYLMIEDLFNRAPAFLRFYLPRTEIGTRYLPLSIQDVLPEMAMGQYIPAVEFEFTEPIDEDNTLTGWVDAVLFDTVSDEQVMFDWKSRKAFPRDDMALIDGQLHLYASVLNTQGASIRRVCMAQMRTGLPKPAELSKKDNLPLTGRASYDTTWEVWAASLPQAVNAEYYRVEMMDKVKGLEAFWHPVFGYVTDASVALTIDNTKMQIENINMVLDNGTLSGVLSYQTCSFCEFAKLCANGFRYGGNVTEILQRDFQQRDSGLEIIMEDEA